MRDRVVFVGELLWLKCRDGGIRQRHGRKRVPGKIKSLPDKIPISGEHLRHKARDWRFTLRLHLFEQRHVDWNSLRGIEGHEPNRRAGGEYHLRRHRIDKHIPFRRAVVRLERAAIGEIAGHADSSAHDHQLPDRSRSPRHVRKRICKIGQRAEREHLDGMSGVRKASR